VGEPLVNPPGEVKGNHPTEEPGGENRRVVRAASVVGAATMLSRICGFLRDMTVALFFGAGAITDAFFVAFRIPNLLRRLLAEGSLTVAFIPVFTGYLESKSRKDAWELANAALGIMALLLVSVTLLGIILAPFIVTVMAPGFTRDPAQYDLTVWLTRLMFPYIFFISLVALAMGILNSLRHFTAPALSPVLLNLAMIAAAFFLRGFFTEPIYALAVGVLMGGFLQLVFQWPFLRRVGMTWAPTLNFRHPGLRQVGRLMLPAVFGGAVYQVNIIIGTILASLLSAGGVSYLYYADRLVELPLGIFGIAVGTAALPSLASLVSRKELGEFKKTVAFSLRLILFVTIPATVALLILGEAIISVLFERGAFTAADTRGTNEALFGYALGLWAFATIRVVVSAFHALQDMGTPLRAAIMALLVNLAASLALMGPLAHAGLALATSIASAANVVTLGVILRRRLGTFLDGTFYRALAKTLLSATIMGGALLLLTHLLAPVADLSGGEKALFLAAAVGMGLVSFFLATWALGCEEVEYLRRWVAAFSRRREGIDVKHP
jgi:putative peptidoglycan lipid II flippase